jgi:hypothetical protein
MLNPDPDSVQYDGRRLDLRDPAYIRDFLPYLKFFYEHYFHVQANGVENLPLKGPALLVGNHSGGLFAADAAMTRPSLEGRSSVVVERKPVMESAKFTAAVLSP